MLLVVLVIACIGIWVFINLIPWYCVIFIASFIGLLIGGTVNIIKSARELNKELKTKKRTINVTYTNKSDESKEDSKN